MKKGFTLIELLAVITILALLLVLTTSTVTKIIKEKKRELYNSQIESFIESAKDWSYKNIDALPTEGNTIKITIGRLQEEHFIKEGVKKYIDYEKKNY